MPPFRQPALQALSLCLPAARRGTALAAALALAWPAFAWAQDKTNPATAPADQPVAAAQPAGVLATRPGEAAPVPSPGPGPNAQGERQIAFEASQVDYNDKTDTVTASGDVLMRSQDQSVRADTVTWTRMTGQIVAEGNVRLVDENGNQVFTDRLELTQELKAGAMQNLLLVMREGGRLAAVAGTRDQNGNVQLTRAAYSGCEVETAAGCPKTPSWRKVRSAWLLTSMHSIARPSAVVSRIMIATSMPRLSLPSMTYLCL